MSSRSLQLSEGELSKPDSDDMRLFFIYGTSSFFRFASFLAQFSAVSFGDPLFASFLIVPLSQRHDFKFRRAVWEEHVGVLRALSIPLDQVKCKADVVI